MGDGDKESMYIDLLRDPYSDMKVYRIPYIQIG